MSNKQQNDNKMIASAMTWDLLADTIMGMEIEFHELSPFMTKKEAKVFLDILFVYEQEKHKRVQELHNPVDYAKKLIQEGYADDDYY